MRLSGPLPLPVTAGLACLALLALSACAEDEASSPSTGSGVKGTVTSVSDVSGLPDTELGGGWVVAVPADSSDELLAALDATDLPARELPNLWAPLQRSAVEGLGGVVAPVDDRGRFTLPAVSGEHLVCLLAEAAGTEQTRGCVTVDLPGSGDLSLTTGEAGLRVEE